MHRLEHPRWVRYGTALLCVASATALRLAFDPLLRDDQQFFTYYLAVIVSAWFGGLGPALLALILGGLIGHYYFVEPRFTLTFADVADAMRVAMFVSVAGSIALFSGFLHRALQGLQRSEQENAGLYEEARQANEAKDRFLAVVSHELRTPVGGILLWSKLLRSGTLSGSQRDAVDKIVQCAEDQSHLVNDLLDTSRIVHGKMHADIVPVDLTTVVESAAEAMRAEALAQQIELDVEASAGVLVNGDPIRLRQVVYNLLANALKFTPPQGHVRITLTCKNATARIDVTDDGEGISPQFLEKLFVRFSQCDTSLTRKHGGMGLGLSIVKDIVNLHGGRVLARSEGLGRGTTFTVTLPLPAAAPGEQADDASRAANHGRGGGSLPDVSHA